MAITKVKSGSSKGSNRRNTKPSSSGSSSKNKAKPSSRHAAKLQKPKAAVDPKKKKQREYTEEELNLPKLNMITPAGVQKPKGKKKGKVFVDDPASMMTIFSMVNAEKEGQIESKMMKARQMEEIRQAREEEMEAKASEKKSKLEETKKSIRRKRKQGDENALSEPSEPLAPKQKAKKRKKVSFG